MRKLLAVAPILSAALFAPAAWSQCENCPTPLISLFDCRILVPEPDGIADPDGWADWVRLFFTAGAIHEQFLYWDAKSSCVAYFDGSLVSQNTIDPESLQVTAGVTWANLPPDGPLDAWGMDYLVVGEINTAAGGYTLTVRLETGPTREAVKTVTVPFADPQGAGLAGIAAATLMIPVFDEISRFEKEKRDSDTRHAVEATLAITPARRKIPPNSSVGVELKLAEQGTIVTTVSEFPFAIISPAEDVTAVEPKPRDLAPLSYTLAQSYPNPCNPLVDDSFRASLCVGREVRILAQEV